MRLFRYICVFLISIGAVLAQTQFGQNSPNTTVFIGDSITAFGNAPETQPDQSYGWGWTAQAVFLSDGRIQQLYNAGYPGQTTAAIAARFRTDVLAYKPGTVVIMGGTNDAANGAFNSTSVTNAVTNLDSMITQAKEAGIQPIICTIPPRADAANYNANAQLLNTAIHKLAQTERTLLVDFYSLLVDPVTGLYKTGYDSGDGIHPSAMAAKAMAQYFITATSNLYGPSQEYLIKTAGDSANLTSNPLFLLPITAWSSNGLGTLAAPTYKTVTGDDSINGNWLSFTFPSATSPGQYYVVNGPTSLMIPGHHMAYSFKFQITGLEANGGNLNMGYGYGATNFTYNYLNDTSGTFYIEFTAAGSSFSPSIGLYPTVTPGGVNVRIAQISLIDLSSVGY